MRILQIHIDQPVADGGDYPVRSCLGTCAGAADVVTGTIPRQLPALAGLDAEQAVREAVLSVHDPAVSVEQVGTYLHDLLDDAGVMAAWREARLGAGPLETRLDIRASVLDALPWELLTEPTEIQPFLSRSNPCVRVRTPFVESSALELPLRVLVVVGDPTARDLEADAELDAITRALAGSPGLWHVETLLGPSYDGFFGRLSDLCPHVLHLIAHGSRAAGQPPRPVLDMFDAGAGNGWWLRTIDIANMEAAPPRLVVLNACRTASLDDQAVARSLSTAFLDKGCAAAVSMQGDVRALAAATFAGRLYGRLAGADDVAVAVASGRDALRPPNEAEREWALPCLTLRADPEDVLKPRSIGQPPAWYPDRSPTFGPVSWLVDRAEKRRELWQALDAHVSGAGASHLVVVHGEEKVGKTALVRSALLIAHLRGHQVALIRLGEDKLNFIDALRRMRDEVGRQAGRQMEEPRRRFDHAIGYLLDGVLPEPMPDVGGRTDDGRPFAPQSERFPDLVAAAFTAFRAMLSETAAGRPFTLAVHRLSSVVEWHLGPYVVPHLLAAPIPGVRLLLLDRTSALGALLPPGLETAAVTMDIAAFPREDLMRLVREYCARRGHPFTADWQRYTEELEPRLTGPLWKPVVLKRIEGYVFPEAVE